MSEKVVAATKPKQQPSVDELKCVGYYLEDWLTYELESSKADTMLLLNSEDFYVPFEGSRAVTRLIFAICDRFELDLHAKHGAIHTFDRYWCKLYWTLLTTHLPASSSVVTEPAKTLILDAMRNQLKIAIAVCVQIASKVDLFKTGLGVKQVKDVLQAIDPERKHTSSTICSYELRILRTLDFRLSRNLPINLVELFVEYLKLNSTLGLLETCYQLLDMSYLHHDSMFKQFYFMANGQKYDRSDPKAKPYLKLETDGAFRAATVVTCSSFFHVLRRNLADTVLPRLATLIDVEETDVTVMSNILHNLVIEEKDYQAFSEETTKSDHS